MKFLRILTRVVCAAYAFIMLMVSVLLLMLVLQSSEVAFVAWSVISQNPWLFLSWVCTVFGSVYILFTRLHGRLVYLALPVAVILLIHGVTAAVDYASARNYPYGVSIMDVVIGSLRGLVLAGGVALAAAGFWDPIYPRREDSSPNKTDSEPQ